MGFPSALKTWMTANKSNVPLAAFFKVTYQGDEGTVAVYIEKK